MTSKLFTSIAVFLLSVSCFSQTIIISGKETNRKLAWSDFTGKPDKNTDAYAYTFWNLRYGFEGVSFSNDTAYLRNLKVTLELDPQKSWVKKGKERDDLLLHEQGHFDIGILCMNEILENVAKETFMRSNYLIRVRTIFNAATAKYSAMGTRYDLETDHSKKIDEQLKWNAFFQRKPD